MYTERSSGILMYTYIYTQLLLAKCNQQQKAYRVISNEPDTMAETLNVYVYIESRERAPFIIRLMLREREGKVYRTQVCLVRARHSLSPLFSFSLYTTRRIASFQTKG